MVKKNKKQKIALLGNPNVGKSSLFNALTGLNQRVGNFPGVTVDKKTGLLQLSEDKQLEILDLPGLYSLFVKSADEAVVLDELQRDMQDGKSKEDGEGNVYEEDMRTTMLNLGEVRETVHI